MCRSNLRGGVIFLARLQLVPLKWVAIDCWAKAESV